MKEVIINVLIILCNVIIINDSIQQYNVHSCSIDVLCILVMVRLSLS